MNMAHHLANLPIDSIGGMVWREQVTKSLPGLYAEVAEHLEKAGVNNLQTINKWKFKKSVRKYVQEKDHSELLESVKR